MTKNQKLFFLSGLFFILLIYANGVRAPFYFDDIEVVNDSLKVDSLSLKNIAHALRVSNVNHRPVAVFSLLVDYHLSKEGKTVLFHIVNIAIHLLGFAFIFLFLRTLLGLPSVPRKYKDRPFPLAFIAAFLWAIHPIQTQAVTYIVQRMTSLCTLFFFMSLYFYLKAREKKKVWLYAGSGAAFLLALGSKELAATLPVAIILIEGLFFRPNKKKFTAVLLLAVIIIAIVSYVFIGNYAKGTIQSLKNNKYANREYLISERLLTEPRVFAHYISLTLFPFYTRYILDYNFPPSHSLFDPPSTFFSLLFLLATVAVAIFLAKKNKILSFAILGFWLGHAIEGSFFNLEIAFEHRMYLPSVFFIFLTVLLGADLIEKVKVPRRAVTVFLGVLVVYLGINTILRNEMWADPIRFLSHNAAKTPENFRPIHNLGVTYGMRREYETALSYFQKALSLYDKAPIVYSGIGQSYFALKNYEAAIPYYQKALAMGLDYPDIYANLSISLLRLKKFDASVEIAAQGLAKHPDDPKTEVTVGSVYYFTVQEMGTQGAELLKKYGLDENRAFAVLDAGYAGGNRDVDVYVNLPSAYVKAALKESSPERRTSWLTKAEHVAVEGTRVFPQDPDIRNNLIGIYLMTGRWKMAADLPEASPDDLNKLSVYLLSAGQYRESLDVLKKAEEKFGLDQVIEFNRAICYYQTGREPEAVVTFKKIMANTSSPSIKSQANYFIHDWEVVHVRK